MLFRSISINCDTLYANSSKISIVFVYKKINVKGSVSPIRQLYAEQHVVFVKVLGH